MSPRQSALLYLLGGAGHQAALALALALPAGAVVVVRDGDLLVLPGLQLAPIETQGTFENVFDLFSKKKKINEKDE